MPVNTWQLSRAGLLLALLLAVLPLAAQEAPAYLSLQSDSPALTTGQVYELRIQVDAVVDLWLASVTLAYDPAQLYVMGTAAGSPVQGGAFFPANTSIIALNTVQAGQVRYAISQLAPAGALSGSGVIGTLRVYPLQPGPAEITFASAELIAARFSGAGAARTAENRPLAFLPVRLALNITGDPVAVPAEATATPAPAPTAIPFQGQGGAVPPTLANLDALPTAAAGEALTPLSVPAVATMDRSGLALLAAGLIGLALAGLALLWRRRR